MKLQIFPAGLLSVIVVMGAIFLGAICSGQVAAQDDDNNDDVRTLRATITGNREQPKVLYIVPWKNAKDEAVIPYQPISAQADKLFAHTERSEHRRHLELLRSLSTAGGPAAEKVATKTEAVADPTRKP